MYVTISAQYQGGNFKGSVGDFVKYLEKENQKKAPQEQELYFNQHKDDINPQTVITQIDNNTAKLKKKEPKFYSIVVSPSKRELKHIGDNPEKLRQYTRELMKAYAASFYRDRTVTVDDIKYYAKIEHERSYSEKDKQIKENQPYLNKILELKNKIREIERGEAKGNIQKLSRQISKIQHQAPHHQNGKMIVHGMQKQGHQSHVHIIVSRKDITNTHSLSPGSKYKASQTILNGRKQKQGFNRNQFYKAAEKTFDTTFGYRRNFVESYHARNLLDKNPKQFFTALSGLPTTERQAAFKLLRATGVKLPVIPVSQAQLAYKTLMKLKRSIGKAIDSGSIGI
ncbi:hypothetical protein SAMN04487906_1893 [Zhouia amylolytica]|uniref:Mobilization protein n=1 Tax=Zhouia amylolytica TaxID=376730 RepID=A0A1I6T715_9FLAO|nr:MobB family relaxase [Zhouia amylolytica]SFS85024.1 hypothetical protein SAMN04487906_1893 [Zhouia amylolytica]